MFGVKNMKFGSCPLMMSDSSCVAGTLFKQRPAASSLVLVSNDISPAMTGYYLRHRGKGNERIVFSDVKQICTLGFQEAASWIVLLVRLPCLSFSVEKIAQK